MNTTPYAPRVPIREYLARRGILPRYERNGYSMYLSPLRDHHVYRPGIQALKELGIVSPLAELHITKAEVKAMAKEWGISVASRPSTPCMATRLPYNTPIDYDVMKQIEVGEGYLRELLGGNVRLRLHGNVVRIEADKTSFGKLLEHGDEIVKTLKNLGFVYITMDLEGFRSGSMDVGLDK